MRRPRVPLIAAIAVGALLGTACGGGGSSSGGGGGGGGGGNTVDATVKDFAIGLDPSTGSAGDVTFNVTNAGPSVHEFVVFETDLAPDALPVEDGTVPEDSSELTAVDELEDLEPGSTTPLDVTLEAGSYVVICNIPGHYEQGMHTGFTVE